MNCLMRKILTQIYRTQKRDSKLTPSQGIKKKSLFYQMTMPSYASHPSMVADVHCRNGIGATTSLPVSGLMYMRKVSLTTSQRLPQCVER